MIIIYLLYKYRYEIQLVVCIFVLVGTLVMLINTAATYSAMREVAIILMSIIHLFTIGLLVLSVQELIDSKKKEE